MWPSFLKDAYHWHCQVLSEKVWSGRGCGFTFLLSQSLEAEHREFEASLGNTVRPHPKTVPVFIHFPGFVKEAWGGSWCVGLPCDFTGQHGGNDVRGSPST